MMPTSGSILLDQILFHVLERLPRVWDQIADEWPQAGVRGWICFSNTSLA